MQQTMSARERNRLKRKAKNSSRGEQSYISNPALNQELLCIGCSRSFIY